MIVVCGEALVDLVPVRPGPDAGRSAAAGAAPGARLLEARPGGSPYNTAVALGRLGTPVSLLARFSDADGFGRQLREHAAASGVGLDLAVAAPEATTLALVDVSEDGGATYTFHAQGTADWAWHDGELPERLPEGTLAVHTGSIALAREPGATALEGFLARVAHEVTVSVDPNVRPALIGPVTEVRERIERWTRLAGLVKVSAEDLEWLHPGEGVDEAARRWLEAGVRLVVVTDGPRGATAHLPGDRTVTRPARPVRVADTVGAGDTLAAGLLDWLARADRLAPPALVRLTEAEAGAALEHALATAAVTVSRVGADPPWRSELAEG